LTEQTDRDLGVRFQSSATDHWTAAVHTPCWPNEKDNLPYLTDRWPPSYHLEPLDSSENCFFLPWIMHSRWLQPANRAQGRSRVGGSRFGSRPAPGLTSTSLRCRAGRTGPTKTEDPIT